MSFLVRQTLKVVTILAALYVAQAGKGDAGADSCSSTSAPSALSPQAIALDLATAHWKSQAIRSLVSSGIADAMAELGSAKKQQMGNDKGDNELIFVDSQEIATKLKLHPQATYRLLRYVSTLEDNAVCIQSYDEPTSFALGPVGHILTSQHPQSAASKILWEASLESAKTWNNLSIFLKTNRHVVQESLNEENVWDYFSNHPDVLAIFSQAMTAYSNDEAVFLASPQLSPTLDLSKCKVICDLGAAEGRLSMVLKDRFPQAHYILADLSEVTARLDASKYPDNFSIQSVNFLDDSAPLPKADAYIVKHIFHDWGDELSGRIFQNIKAANADATIYVIEFGPMPGPNIPHLSKGFDLHMGVLSSALERTQEEYDALFQANGYKRIATHMLEHNHPLYVQEIKAT